ncbi:MAG: hypothetical protein AMS16_01720 [Planctomycetes bacterium DG_58]|nr:MAG: hypothetical protein AMS16_01720 [Planctomycetes bacterium DG_58]KPL02083.1 MAG: hypothetical protein AMK75_03310 [Planctomycetes bacterium SM23_65]
MSEACAICGCKVHRKGDYARDTIKGRSHATKHHFVALRFLGLSPMASGKKRKPIFKKSPWTVDEETEVFCYECHEELLHNPVFLPEDVERFGKLVRLRGLAEHTKRATRDKIAGRIKLLHEVIEQGIFSLLDKKCLR